jgi:hypothetical protein
VPVVNPDGYVYNQTTNPGGGGMWRKNRRNNGGGTFGVDLNRNYADHWGWDDTGSSPSRRATPTAARPPRASPSAGHAGLHPARQFQSSLSVHTYSNLWLYPFGYAQVYPTNNAQYVEVSNLATEVNHYQVGPPAFILYLANGVTCDYDHDQKGTLAWSPELGSSSDGFWPPTQSHRAAGEREPARDPAHGARGRSVVARTLLDAHRSRRRRRILRSRRERPVQRDGAQQRTRGERQRGDHAGELEPVRDGHERQATASVRCGAFSQATSAALSLAIAPNAPSGTTIDYTLTLSYEGWNQVENGSFGLGQPVPILIDDAESIGVGRRASRATRRAPGSGRAARRSERIPRASPRVPRTTPRPRRERSAT